MATDKRSGEKELDSLLIRKTPDTCESCPNSSNNLSMVVELGRISVIIPDKLEKELRFKTVERFGGKKGDLSRAVEDAVRTWVTKDD